MLAIFRNKYIIAFMLVYLASASVLTLGFGEPAGDIAIIFISFGCALSLIAWVLVKNIPERQTKQPLFRNEFWVILALILFFVWYVTFGTAQINKLFPEKIKADPRTNDFLIMLKKLLVLVFIPFLVYKGAGFSFKDFGLNLKNLRFRSSSLIVLVVISIVVLLFQYFLSGGARPVREGQFSFHQLLIATPLLFVWLLFETGLVEEFFFRAFLQTRLAVLLRSATGGIILSGLIFGLAHAPGLFLRGAESEGVSEQLPFMFWASYTICFMSLAGIFLGIIYHRTKNLWLVMAIHAMTDLLPNLDNFIHTWKIR